MAMPTLAVQIAPGDAWSVESPTWVAVTADVRNGTLQFGRGRSASTSTVYAGSVSFQLNDPARLYDPAYTAGTYYGNLVPLMQVRVTATHNAVTYNLFRGFVTDWQSVLVEGQPVVIVQAMDGLSVLQQLLIGSTYESEVTADAPVAWWKLDETSGTNANNSGSGGTDGTYQNTPTLAQTGPMSGMVAPTFDGAGSSEYVSVGAAAGTDTDTAWTIEGWMYPTTGGGVLVGINTGSGEYEIGFLTGYGIQISGPVGFNYYFAGTASIAESVWTHWAVTFTPSNVFTLYLNGVLIEAATITAFNNATYTGTMNVALGRYSGTASGYFDGKQCQVAIYNSALSASRIAAHAGKAFNGFSSELTSARATSVLDNIGWAAGLRAISTGNTTLTALQPTTAITALTVLQQAIDSEDGFAYCDGAGNYTFIDRDSPHGTVDLSVGDTGEPGFTVFTKTTDDLNLRNLIRVTDSAGDALEVSDTTSQAAYAPRALSRTTYTTSTTEPVELGYMLLGRYAEPEQEVSDLTMKFAGGSTNAEWAALLGLELGDLLKVTYTHPSGVGSAETFYGYAESLQWQQSASEWTVTARLAHATVGGMVFTLDDAIAGQLDGPGRLGF